MHGDSPWNDPRTWTAVTGSVVGLLGFVYGVVSGYWNRRESRLDALSKALQPMLRAAQHLHQANNSRRKCEILRRSFPDPEQAKEAKARLDEFFERYAKHIGDSEEQFRLAESEFASRSFRFPDSITALVREAFKSLSEFGKYVNEGFFDNADVQFGKFSDDYKRIQQAGRGWRLADPFEGVRKRLRKKPPAPPASKFDLSKEELDGIMELVGKRAASQSQNAFAVHPPKKLLEHPEIAKSDRVIEELEDSAFMVVFQDGTAKMLSFVELMVFTYNLIVLALQYREIDQMMRSFPGEAGGTVDIKVNFNFSVDQIMRPETVRVLLDKISFSEVATDEVSEGEGAELEQTQGAPPERR